MSKNEVGKTTIVTKGTDPKSDGGKKHPEKGSIISPQLAAKFDFVYQVTDPTLVAYTLQKALIDITLPDNDSRDLYRIFRSPAGITSMLLSTGLLTTLGLIGQINLKDKSERTRRWLEFINTFSKYLREGIQGTKYLYKANRIAFKIMQHYMDADTRVLLSAQVLLNAIIVLSIISLITRIGLKDIREKRKKKLEYNRFILKHVIENNGLSTWIEVAKEETAMLRSISMGFVILNAVVDIIYSYYGLLTLVPLAAFSPPVLIVLLTLCTLYSLALMVSRIAEEYQQQQELVLSKLELEIACKMNELILVYDLLIDDQDDQKLKTQESNLILELKKLKQEKLAMDSGGYGGAFLKGLKKGLSFYAIIGTLAGTSSTGTNYANVALPPEAVIFFVTIGLAVLIIYTAWFMIQCYKNSSKTINPQVQENCDEGIQVLESAIKPAVLPLTEGFGLEEVWRSACSAVNKAIKTVSVAFTALQKVQEDGQRKDHPGVFFGVGVPSSLAAAVVYAMAGHAKNKKNKPYDPNVLFQPKLEEIRSRNVSAASDIDFSDSENNSGSDCVMD